MLLIRGRFRDFGLLGLRKCLAPFRSGTDALGRGLVTPCVGVGDTCVHGKADGVYSCVLVVYEYVFH